MRPSCASRVNTGRKLTVIINKLKNSAGPTSVAALATICQRFCSLSASPSKCLCIFSIITIAPSIIAPMAIAIPPSDIILAFRPCRCITIKAVKIPTGKLTMATRDERIWNRNTMQTSATTANSSSSLCHKLLTALSIKPERS